HPLPQPFSLHDALPISGQRRFATQHYQLEKLKALAHASGGSLNDIVLYLCGTALRRFLLEQGNLPDTPLTAGIPVNIRPADDQGDRKSTRLNSSHVKSS